ncbi:hypothetical protein FA13DRAFT_1769554 [Coprinellus micaceus]|uniref:Uncharacterized protein n=1 Tax=Coprinellus micaceus TaxID=71717 RepID=A0A4Y7U192_COPMI|nr:hypothetical protein FA13DRAFT_1769554 [Coprinellus micaceus]
MTSPPWCYFGAVSCQGLEFQCLVSILFWAASFWGVRIQVSRPLYPGILDRNHNDVGNPMQQMALDIPQESHPAMPAYSCRSIDFGPHTTLGRNHSEESGLTVDENTESLGWRGVPSGSTRELNLRRREEKILSWICERELKWSDPDLEMAKLSKSHYHNVRPHTASTLPAMANEKRGLMAASVSVLEALGKNDPGAMETDSTLLQAFEEGFSPTKGNSTRIWDWDWDRFYVRGPNVTRILAGRSN